MKQRPLSRRHFALSAGAALTALQATRVQGANARVQVAIVGLGGRGRDHMDLYSAVPTCDIAALCDVDQAALERGVARVHATGRPPLTWPTAIAPSGPGGPRGPTTTRAACPFQRG